MLEQKMLHNGSYPLSLLEVLASPTPRLPFALVVHNPFASISTRHSRYREKRVGGRSPPNTSKARNQVTVGTSHDRMPPQ